MEGQRQSARTTGKAHGVEAGARAALLAGGPDNGRYGVHKKRSWPTGGFAGGARGKERIFYRPSRFPDYDGSLRDRKQPAGARGSRAHSGSPAAGVAADGAEPERDPHVGDQTAPHSE